MLLHGEKYFFDEPISVNTRIYSSEWRFAGDLWAGVCCAPPASPAALYQYQSRKGAPGEADAQRTQRGPRDLRVPHGPGGTAFVPWLSVQTDSLTSTVVIFSLEHNYSCV